MQYTLAVCKVRFPQILSSILQKNPCTASAILQTIDAIPKWVGYDQPVVRQIVKAILANAQVAARQQDGVFWRFKAYDAFRRGAVVAHAKNVHNCTRGKHNFGEACLTIVGCVGHCRRGGAGRGADLEA